MLVVVQLEQLRRVVRLERRVVIGKSGSVYCLSIVHCSDLSMRHRRNYFCGINNKGGVGLRTREKKARPLGSAKRLAT